MAKIWIEVGSRKITEGTEDVWIPDIPFRIQFDNAKSGVICGHSQGMRENATFLICMRDTDNSFVQQIIDARISGLTLDEVKALASKYGMNESDMDHEDDDKIERIDNEEYFDQSGNKRTRRVYRKMR